MTPLGSEGSLETARLGILLYFNPSKKSEKVTPSAVTIL
jgi:hypothetical protein